MAKALKLLAVETTSPVLSAAVGDAERCLASASRNAGMRHAEEVLPLIDDLLDAVGWKKQDLTGVAASRGPGSFTGIRVGISLARAIAQGLGIPTVSVSTLEALAEPYREWPGCRVFCALDALRGQVYSACYLNGKTILKPGCRSWNEAFRAVRAAESRVPLIVVGEAAWTHEAELLRAFGKKLDRPVSGRYPAAESIWKLGVREWRAGRAMPYSKLLPEYMREPFTTVAKKRMSS